MDDGSMQSVCLPESLQAAHGLQGYIAYLEVVYDQDGNIPDLLIDSDKDVRVGRESDCDFTIPDILVSKQHFRIYSVIYDDELLPLVYCEDLESTNGTYVNGKLIGMISKENRGYLLSNGDVIEIRPYWKFRFHQEIPASPHRNSTQKDFKCFQDRFDVSDRMLGEGTFGAVYLAYETGSRNQVACKIVNFNDCAGKKKALRFLDNSWHQQLRRNEEALKIAKREIQILASLSNPHIINLKKAFCTSTALYMITELAPGGDLVSYLQAIGGHLEDWHARVLSHQLTIAIQYLHSEGIVHRDIKPENVLITHTGYDGRVILTDFGFANRVDIKTHRLASYVGTTGFIAPEIKCDKLRQKGYTAAADLWSLGVLTACLLTGDLCIPNKFSQLSQQGISESVLEIDDPTTRYQWSNMKPRALGFLRCLLKTDPAKRMTALQALHHAWFKEPEAEAVALEESHKKIIRFWKQRDGNEPIIEDVKGPTPPHEQLEMGPRVRKRLPSATISPYPSLYRRVNQREPTHRQELLNKLAESGQLFMCSPKPEYNLSQIEPRERMIDIHSDGIDMFRESQETTLSSLGSVDHVHGVPTEPPLSLDTLNLEIPAKTSMLQVGPRRAEDQERNESRERNSVRKDSWKKQDKRLHSLVAKRHPHFASAKVFRDNVRIQREADMEKNTSSY